jgi:condensin complex subunit 1
MDDRVNFDINESLKHFLSDPTTVPTPEADPALVDCENDPESLTNGLINGVLNPIVDSIAENPEGVTRSSNFDSLQFLLKCAPISLQPEQNYPGIPDSKLFRLSRSTSLIPTHALRKILDLVVSGLSTESDIIQNDLETDEQDAIQHHKQLLEVYGYLLQWTVSAVETKAAEKSATAAPARRGGKASKAKASAKDGNWDSSGQLQTAMDTMCKVLKLKLSRIFLTTSDRDTFVNLFTRSIYLVLENEQRVKNTAIRMHAFKVLCIAVKHHGHAFGNAYPSSFT